MVCLLGRTAINAACLDMSQNRGSGRLIDIWVTYRDKIQRSKVPIESNAVLDTFDMFGIPE